MYYLKQKATNNLSKTDSVTQIRYELNYHKSTIATITIPTTISIVDRYMQHKREEWKKQKYRTGKKRAKRVMPEKEKEEEDTINKERRGIKRHIKVML